MKLHALRIVSAREYRQRMFVQEKMNKTTRENFTNLSQKQQNPLWMK